MMNWLRRILIGSPLPNWRSVYELLPKVLALPIFASDALSSVAYATEEILLILVLAGTAVLSGTFVIQISAAIVILLFIVATSYRQTIFAYPSGGGAYIVAKENLGKTAGLTAGAALTIDYILTVAVSISSGVAAIISIHPGLAPYAVWLALGGIGIVTVGNLRGVRESGLLFALPTYLFIFSALTLIAVGIYREQTVGLRATLPPGAEVPSTLYGGVGLFLILRAFSSGCAAMTGTEAISNAVQAFRSPESKNAAATLMIMATILGTLFFGIGYLAWATHVVPMEPLTRGYETVVSQIARTTFSGTSMAWFHIFIQYATAAILMLAANTSFAGFPRLASIMARDRFLPRQFYNVGDRLVFSNGIVVLAVLASILVIMFRADTNALIPLYAVGVFLSFTLSQSGMVKRFIQLKRPGWKHSVIVSGIGAIATGIVTIVIVVSKFPLEGWSIYSDGRLNISIPAGAWLVVILITLFVYIFSKIHEHYIRLGNQLRLTQEDQFNPIHSTMLVLTPSLHRGVLPALEYAKGLCSDVRAIHIDTDPIDAQILEERWERWGGGIPLVILESPFRSLVGPLLQYLEEVKREKPNTLVTVIIPEFVPAKWWHKILHNQSGLVLKFVLLFRRDIITANVRYYVGK